MYRTQSPHRTPLLRLMALAAVAVATLAPAASWAEALPLTSRAADATGKERRAEPAPLELEAAEIEEAIRSIYSRFAEISRASGQEIRFELGETRTYSVDALDGIYWLDLFTLPGGYSIETVPYVRLGDLPSESLLNYRSSWTKKADAHLRAEDLLADLRQLETRDALAQLAEEDAQRYAGVTTLASFDMRVQFDDRSRDYRALVLFKPLASGKVLFSLGDHVVPSIAQAFDETRTVVDTSTFEAPASEPGIAGDPDDRPLKDLCTPATLAPVSGPLLSTGTLGNDHFTGGHSGSLRVRRTCSVNALCESICTPTATTQICSESGVTGFTHGRFTTVAIRNVAGPPGQRGECGYAWGCAVKSCPLIFCGGVEFGVEGAGVGISIAVDSPVLSDMSLSDSGTCPPAIVPTPCQEPSTGLVVLPLDGDAEAHHLPSKSFTLTRVEKSDVVHHGMPMSYLLGEWAVLSYDAQSNEKAQANEKGSAGDTPRLVRASSTDFGAAKAADLGATLRGLDKSDGDGPRTALVVALPPHEANSRKIPMPELRLRERSVPSGTPQGRVLVRADFDEKHRLQNLQTLHSTFGGIGHDLAVRIERALELQRATDEDHRVIVFAVLDIDDELTIASTLPYLPKCCCLGGVGGTVCP